MGAKGGQKRLEGGKRYSGRGIKVQILEVIVFMFWLLFYRVVTINGLAVYMVSWFFFQMWAGKPNKWGLWYKLN